MSEQNSRRGHYRECSREYQIEKEEKVIAEKDGREYESEIGLIKKWKRILE
jgi:hypothetical protein